MITGKQISKIYEKGGEQVRALNKVSITIKDGEFVAVMGPSGCGKSTLLFSLSGMDTIDGGLVKLNGRELTGLTEDELCDLRREKMGFVFQQPVMLKTLNILDNIILPALHSRPADMDRINRRAGQLMAQTGIGNLADRNITEVSGGQLQRAGICRALINQPDILFADEPTGALNSKSADEIMELFDGINQQGTAIMLVTHDAKVAAKARRVLFMKDGEIADEMKMSAYPGRSMLTKMNLILERMSKVEK